MFQFYSETFKGENMSDAQTTYKIQFTEKESIEAGLIAVFPSFES